MSTIESKFRRVAQARLLESLPIPKRDHEIAPSKLVYSFRAPVSDAHNQHAICVTETDYQSRPGFWPRRSNSFVLRKAAPDDVTDGGRRERPWRHASSPGASCGR